MQVGVFFIPIFTVALVQLAYILQKGWLIWLQILQT
nr:MAG TPA: hypothetical protein [Caudoviricetes sp.]